jgi:hypothetical protein
MAVRAISDDAQGLLKEIKKQIDAGHIDTWSYDSDGDFTHTPPQWKNQAWLKPTVEKERLRLRIMKRKNKALAREVFAVYQGRFIEMLVKHVPDLFSDARATPKPATDEPSVVDE